MRKQIFLMLVLAMTGIASVNAQMRIGGSEVPNQSAVLDLNPDNNVLAGLISSGIGTVEKSDLNPSLLME